MLAFHRKRLYKFIVLHCVLNKNSNILDIGSTADSGSASNIFLSFFEATHEVTSISNQVIPIEVSQRFSKTKFILDDALNLNFSDDKFDLVFSNATIEHVGSLKHQKIFIQEALRVAKNTTVIITPNRWFPIETHTKLPLIHFLAKNHFRKIIKFLGFSELSKEENLNLISIKEIRKILNELGICNYKILKIKFFCITSNIAVIINKPNSFKN